MLSTLQHKNLIRSKVKEKINQLSIKQKKIYSAQMLKICTEFLARHNMFNNLNIACYLPTKNEINCSNLIKILLNNNKCYLPKVNKITNSLDFLNYTFKKSELEKNYLGIYEPKFNAMKKIAIENLDLILIPLLAFDLKGHRIGSGYGYYDRSLIINNHKVVCPIVGLAYSIQQVYNFAKDPWDIDLDVIITEKWYYSFNDRYY